MDFAASVEIILSGPTLRSILLLMNKRHSEQPVMRLDVDNATVWDDAIAFYKSKNVDFSKQIQVRINSERAIDAGRVRAQMYTTIYDIFAQNKKIVLLDGDPRHLRPHCSAEAGSSGLFKVLGMMVGHSIIQDGIGFQYLSGVCYWYVAGKIL